MIFQLTPTMAVASQLAPADCAAARAQGFAALINNRPDGEVPGQPECAAMRAAAEAAGLTYTPIPVGHAGMSLALVEAMADALDAASGPVLAFCRSGTRSANLWALAEARRGGDPEAIIAAAENGGYDVAGLRPTLRRLAGLD